jgi:drug/metabolite transporter (DMT)-like permease
VRVRRLATPDVLLLVTVLLWGLNFTVTKYVITHGFQPLAYSSIRYTAGAMVFAAFTYGRERSLAVRRLDLPLLLAAAAVGIWLNQAAYVYALKLTTASTTALILGITPVFAALIAFAVGVERVGAGFVAGALVSFSGVALVAAGTGGELSASLRGIALGIATAVTWAAYSVAIAPLMRRYSPYRISAIVLLAGCIPLAISGARQLASQDFSVEPLVWAALVFALFGPLVLTNILFFSAIDRVGPSRATLFTNLVPFVAVVFAVLLLSEPLRWLQVLGGVTIVAGIFLARRPTTAPAE